MRVLLISANRERINMVTLPLGLGLVAAATRRAGHDVAFLDLAGVADAAGAVWRAIDEHRPDVIGVSVRNIDDQSRDAPRFLLVQAREVVQACRALTSAPIVVGGAGYSIFPAEALRYLGANLGVAGDGEEAFPAVLDRLAAGEPVLDLPGVYAAGREPRIDRVFSDDLDALPSWDEALDPLLAPDVWIPVQSRRGCANDCSYCSTWLIQGRRLRARSAASVVGAIQRLALRGARQFHFVDNTFNIPDDYALELSRGLATVRPGVSWRCIIYPHRVREDLVTAMAAGGCCEVALGFESGCPRILRAMNKRFTPDEVREAAARFAAHGIRRWGFLLLGGPGETRESVEESLAFARSLQLDDLRVTVGIRIYPGTPLARTAVAEGVVASEADLLHPSFYLAPGLEPWIHQRVEGLGGARG